MVGEGNSRWPTFATRCCCTISLAYVTSVLNQARPALSLGPSRVYSKRTPAPIIASSPPTAILTCEAPLAGVEVAAGAAVPVAEVWDAEETGDEAEAEVAVSVALVHETLEGTV